MILNLITFFSCLLLIIFFRRLDRSNLRMTKLKRYSSKIYSDFKKLSENELRKYHDATIEMDILIKKSNTNAQQLKETVAVVEKKMATLNAEKEILAKAERELEIISDAAKDVNKQIEFIAGAKAGIGDIGVRINTLSEDLSRVEREMSSILQAYNEKIREKSRNLSEEIALNINDIRESIKEKESDLIESSRDKIELLNNQYLNALSNMEERVSNAGAIIVEDVNQRLEETVKTINSFEKKIESVEKRVISEFNVKVSKFEKTLNNLENVDDNIEHLSNKLRSVEDNVNESTSRLISTFDEEVKKARLELNNLDIHTIAKKDEIVKSVRKEAEEIRIKIDNFDDKYSALEKRIVETINKETEELKTKIDGFEERYSELTNKINEAGDENINNIHSEYQAMEVNFNELLNKVSSFEVGLKNFISEQTEKNKKDFVLMEQRLVNIKDEIMQYEEKQNIFSRSDLMISKVEEAINNFTKILKDSKEEAKKLEMFMEDAEKFKIISRVVDKEIKKYEAKRDKLSGYESEIKALMELNDIATGKAESLENNLKNIDKVNSKIDGLMDTYSSLEARIAELHEYEDTISKNLESIQKTDLIIKSIDSRIAAFKNNTERSDKRVQKLIEYLQSIEENTLILKSREQEIKDVKDKFNELDGLTRHIEKRIDQIHAMFQKTESMREEIDDTDDRLKKMFDETDKKIKQFADILHSVEENNLISRQIKADYNLGKNINEGMIKAVRELSNKGWKSDEISQKLLIDENSVRFIINTSSL